MANLKWWDMASLLLSNGESSGPPPPHGAGEGFLIPKDWGEIHTIHAIFTKAMRLGVFLSIEQR